MGRGGPSARAGGADAGVEAAGFKAPAFARLTGIGFFSAAVLFLGARRAALFLALALFFAPFAILSPHILSISLAGNTGGYEVLCAAARHISDMRR